MGAVLSTLRNTLGFQQGINQVQGDQHHIMGIQTGTNQVHGNMHIHVGRPMEHDRSSTYKAIHSVCIPLLATTFVGMVSQLGRIGAALSARGRACIQGMAGSGKTSIATKYILSNTDNYGSLIWVDARTKAEMTRRFQDVARRLGLSFTNLVNTQEFTRSEIEEIYDALSSHATVIVFDNAESYATIPNVRDGISEFLPSQATRPGGIPPKILVTTRNIPGWDQISPEKDVIHLEFSVSDAKELILSTLTKQLVPDVEDNWKLLSDFCNNLPIAIESAVGRLKALAKRNLTPENPLTLQRFIREFRLTTGPQLLPATLNENQDPIQLKVKTLWENSFLELQNESHYFQNGRNALEMLNILAFFSPHATPVHLLCRTLWRLQSKNDSRQHSPTDSTAFESFLRNTSEPALEILESMSFVKRHKDIIVVSRLLQQNRLQYLRNGNQLQEYVVKLCSAIQSEGSQIKESEAGACESFGMILEQFLDNTNLLNALQINSGIIQYFHPTTSHKAYSRVVLHLGGIEGKDQPSTIEMRVQFLRFLRSNSMFDESIQLLREDFHRQRKEIGQDDPRTIATRNILVDHLSDSRMGEEALEILKQDLIRQVGKHGIDHAITVETRKTLISQLLNHRKVGEALEMLRIEYLRQNAKFGPDVSATLETRNKLIRILIDNPDGSSETAELDQAFAEWSRHKMAESDTSLTTEARNNFLNLLVKSPRLKYILRLVEAEWSRQRALLGPDDSRTLETRDKFLIRLLEKTKKGSSIPILSDELNRQKSKLIPNYSRTVLTRDLLLQQYFEMNQVMEAISLLRPDYLEQREKIGMDNPKVLRIRAEVINQLSDLGKTVALTTFTRLEFHRQQNQLGHDDPRTLSTRNLLLNYIWRSSASNEEVLDILKAEYSRQCDSLSPDDPSTLQTRNQLILRFCQIGQFDSALEILRSELSRQSNCLPRDDVRLHDTRDQLIENLFQLHRTDEAMALVSKEFARIG